jgi:lipid-A-disaccharide synthase-like uncharacterized protein
MEKIDFNNILLKIDNTNMDILYEHIVSIKYYIEDVFIEHINKKDLNTFIYKNQKEFDIFIYELFFKIEFKIKMIYNNRFLVTCSFIDNYRDRHILKIPLLTLNYVIKNKDDVKVLTEEIFSFLYSIDKLNIVIKNHIKTKILNKNN